MRSGLVLTTAATGQPVRIEVVRQHLRVTAADDDELILQILRAAIDRIERRYSLALMPQSWNQILDSFPRGLYEPIRILRRPVQSINAVTYLDSGGTTQTLDSGQYRLDTSTTFPRLAPRPGTSWPLVVTESIANVTIDFDAGYTDADAVPPAIKQAILMLCEDFYVSRGNMIAISSGSVSTMPVGVEAIMADFAPPMVA